MKIFRLIVVLQNTTEKRERGRSFASVFPISLQQLQIGMFSMIPCFMDQLKADANRGDGIWKSGSTDQISILTVDL